MNYSDIFRIFILLSFLFPFYASADGSLIDKIYHPYVQPQEKEFEIRGGIQSNDENNPNDGFDTYRFAYGQSLNDRWFAELYLIAQNVPNDNLDLESAELELLWQMTEQGEYAADWGMLFEIERSLDHDISEISTALLTEKQWGKWVGTANMYLIYEWGSDIKSEFETGLVLQTRYRYSRSLEPAVELYMGENSKGIGPVFLGNIKLGNRKQLRWETGIIAGLSDDTPDTTFKFLIELEFY